MMDAVFQWQHSISLPANLTFTTGDAIRTTPSTPSTEVLRKRPRDSQAILPFLKDQPEREEDSERQALAREQERERAATQRAE